MACGRTTKHVSGTADPVSLTTPSTPVSAEAIPVSAVAVPPWWMEPEPVACSCMAVMDYGDGWAEP